VDSLEKLSYTVNNKLEANLIENTHSMMKILKAPL